MPFFTRGSNRPHRRALLRAALGALAAVVLVSVGLIAQDRHEFNDSPYLRIDPEKITLSERDSRTPCGECHASEFETWQGTSHATGFNEMHRTETARDILRQMDLRVTKRQESLCMRCHYTVGPDLDAIAGVSCESCHGPARDWLNVHNDYGEGVERPEQESPEHRAQRIAMSEEGGMLRPSGDLYAVAANCFECHTVPVEDLVNTGGHRSGTDGFDLPARIDEIRHNFLHEQWGEEGGNREPSMERERLLLVLSRMLGYEYTLRGLAEATTEDGSYYRSMHRRAVNARGRLEEVTRAVDIPEVTRILEVGQGLDMSAGQSASLLEAAEAMREIGQEFARATDHPDLAALDPLVEGGQLPPPAAAAAPVADASGGGSGDAAGSGSADGAAAESGAESAAAAEEPSLPELPGSIRSRPAWQSPPDHQYLGDNGECMSCHVGAEEWWFDSPHDGSHAKLARMTDRRAVEIARLYGIGSRGMIGADQICMNCHGTVLNAAIAQPVGCESCHGPAADYLDPHSDGGNPQAGMRALKDPAARAQNCARCHHISDERLLAAGHPSGSDYDLASAVDQIRHWPDRRVDRRRDGPYPEADGAALSQAYAAATSGRPVPQVTVAQLPERPSSPSGSSGGSSASGPSAGSSGQASAPATRAQRSPEASAPSQPPRSPRTVPAAANAANLSLDLEPIPATTDSMSTEDLLLLVKQRLERVYTALRNNR